MTKGWVALAGQGRAGLARVACMCVVAAAVSGCEDLPPLQMESEHFRYHARKEAVLCPGLLDWLEHHYMELSAVLGAELPEGQKFDYFKLRDRGDLASNACGTVEASGCAGDRSVFSVQAYHPHELLHVYSNLVGRPPLFFQEGLAEVLGCGLWSDDLVIDRSVDIMAYFETSELSRLDTSDLLATYPQAAGFTRFLIDTYGWERYLEFYRSTSRSADLAAISASFADAFGDEVTSAIEAWRSGPPQTLGGVCLHVAECATEGIPEGMTTVDGFPCGDAVHPSTNLNWPLALIRSVRVNEVAGLRIRSLSEDPTLTQVRSCDSELRPPRRARGSAGERAELWTDLDVGNYWAAFFQAADPRAMQSDAMLELEREGPVLAGDCPGAVERDVGNAESVQLRASLRGNSQAFVRFRVPESKLFGVSGLSEVRDGEIVPVGAESFLLCSGGCPAEGGACEQHTTNQPEPPVGDFMEIAGGTSYVLIIDDLESTNEVWLDLHFEPLNAPQ